MAECVKQVIEASLPSALRADPWGLPFFPLLRGEAVHLVVRGEVVVVAVGLLGQQVGAVGRLVHNLVGRGQAPRLRLSTTQAPQEASPVPLKRWMKRCSGWP